MAKDEFYIGWRETAPDGFRKKGKSFFFIFLTVVMVFVAVYIPSQKKFENSVFEFGTLTELEGRLVNYPVIGLRTTIDEEPVTVPLVGFGKKGADAVITHLVSRLEGDPSNYQVRLRGTIIKYQDKVWMELTGENESIISFSKTPDLGRVSINNHGIKQLYGEIVDPKCFFGVMKPGYSKIHRSCAIRCISGGIPPVLAISQQGDFTDYYFLTDAEGAPLNREILEYVGQKVAITGVVEQIADWKNIKLDLKDVHSMLSGANMGKISFCQ